MFIGFSAGWFVIRCSSSTRALHLQLSSRKLARGHFHVSKDEPTERSALQALAAAVCGPTLPCAAVTAYSGVYVRVTLTPLSMKRRVPTAVGDELAAEPGV